jgi:hypothetical protein
MRVGGLSLLGEETPIVVTPAAAAQGATAIAFDAGVLAALFGAKWPEVEQALDRVLPREAHRELMSLLAADDVSEDVLALLALGETGLIERDPAAPAALVLVLLHEKLRVLTRV